jgi:hypothetical protein
MTSAPPEEPGSESWIAGYKPRQSERTALNTKTRLTQQNWYSVEVTLCDLSSTGFRALCDDNVTIGSYVMLDVPGLGQVRAQVRWQVWGKMGGQFLDPIRLSRCEWSAIKAPGADQPAQTVEG